ncbi:hypothetical protein QR680_018005 [Steinernema hermaphroditum]|uniref:G-protein coupled receptors family 1 profile domain-containing protein n=1 Tax=Steinernema hermaphroditum TaxID=289476 RepID=A0AA39LPP5_9BILA|nr:hypothetical protein QR680_018005 [Steinernema hermaphroditum]
MDKCVQAMKLSESTTMKVVVCIKIAINLLSSLGILYTFRSLKQSRSYRIVHKNVRLTLNFHIFYILLANVFMMASNTIDLNRLSAQHDDPCRYLLPLWVTFTVRETYMFGVLGQTFTFVILSIERIMATFMRTYEHLQSKNLIVFLISAKMGLCLFLVYFYIGFDADWSEKTVQFFPQTEQNKSRIRVFTYLIVGCALLSIIAYHVTYFLNSRGINRISTFDKRRVTQISKTLSEKYQIDENRKVIQVMLPMAWVHFILYFGAYGGYITLFHLKEIDDIEDAILSEALGLITFYAPIFAVYVRWQFSIKPKKDAEKIVDKIYSERKSDYFRQMNELFESNVAIKQVEVRTRRKFWCW